MILNEERAAYAPCTTIIEHKKALHDATVLRDLTKRGCQRRVKVVIRFLVVATTTSQHESITRCNGVVM